MFNIPGKFRHWMLLIVFGNCLLTYLFEKVVISFISEWNHDRLERKRLSKIQDVVKDGRSELENYFKEKH